MFKTGVVLWFAWAGLAAAQETWVELGPGGVVLARYAAPTGGQCPAIAINGKPRAMSPRQAVGSFDALVCQTVIPKGANSAEIDGKRLPLPKWKNGRLPNVVVVGDTGCRVKLGSDDPAARDVSLQWNIQDCNDAKAWPFEQVAGQAADEKPDVVIHVGDYLYREKNCAGVKGCPGGPAGDSFATWQADFFTPARKLLQTAPWVFVRGNHENCGRAGNGWFTLLDTADATSCKDFTEPFRLKVGTLPLVVLDDSTASDAACANPADQVCATRFEYEVTAYARYFREITRWKLKGAWLLSHRPVWSVRRGGTGVTVLCAALEAAWRRQRPGGVGLLLAGHTHTFEVIGFTPQSGHTVQLVLGNSGTSLAPPAAFDPKDAEVQRAGIQQFQRIQGFGFTTIVPDGKKWKVTEKDRTGRPQLSCGVGAGLARCTEL